MSPVWLATLQCASAIAITIAALRVRRHSKTTSNATMAAAAVLLATGLIGLRLAIH